MTNTYITKKNQTLLFPQLEKKINLKAQFEL